MNLEIETPVDEGEEYQLMVTRATMKMLIALGEECPHDAVTLLKTLIHFTDALVKTMADHINVSHKEAIEEYLRALKKFLYDE